MTDWHLNNFFGRHSTFWHSQKSVNNVENHKWSLHKLKPINAHEETLKVKCFAWHKWQIGMSIKYLHTRRLAAGILSDRINAEVFTFSLLSIDSTDCVLCMQKMFTSCQFFPHFNFLWRRCNIDRYVCLRKNGSCVWSQCGLGFSEIDFEFKYWRKIKLKKFCVCVWKIFCSIFSFVPKN
jgi:hypothetical protein